MEMSLVFKGYVAIIVGATTLATICNENMWRREEIIINLYKGLNRDPFYYKGLNKTLNDEDVRLVKPVTMLQADHRVPTGCTPLFKMTILENTRLNVTQGSHDSSVNLKVVDLPCHGMYQAVQELDRCLSHKCCDMGMTCCEVTAQAPVLVQADVPGTDDIDVYFRYITVRRGCICVRDTVCRPRL